MKYHRPQWNEISKAIPDHLSELELDKTWYQECNKWLEQLIHDLGLHYKTYESDNFIILSSETQKHVDHFLSFLESTRTIILNTLEGIASDKGYGKHVVMILADQETYYDYIAMYYPSKGEFGLSAGVYINEGYGHFVFPAHEINYNEPVAAHELTHACLSHLPIPVWLDEGLAVSMEGVVISGRDFYIDKEIIGKHRNYWNPENIQSFWSGESFKLTDDGQELSYHLAQLLVRNISKEYLVFKTFVTHANEADAGEKAAREYLNISLGDLLEGLLGEGDWSPQLGTLKQ